MARLSARAKWEASQEAAQATPAPERPRVLIDLKGGLKERSRHLRERANAIETARLAKLAELEAERDFHDNEATRKQAAPPAPVADSASNAPAWTVIKPLRYNGYTAPLHRLIAAAHRDGKPCPTARDVVEAWRNNAPAEIAKVLPDGFDYYDTKGDTKTADLEAIRKAIGRMTSAR